MAARELTILHVNTERGWRGGERQTLWLAEGLAQAGHRVLIAARPSEPLARRADEAGISTITCTAGSELDLPAGLALRRCILRERVDIVHAHTGHAVALTAMGVWRTGARMIVTRRTGFPLHANPLTRWKYRRADAVIAISSRAARALMDGGIDRSVIEVIPSGVRLDRDTPPLSRHELGVRDGAPLVVMVGALTPEKDPLTFVRAVAAARRRSPALCADRKSVV